MDNFNLQSFVKKSKDEFYAKLYEGKKEHAMEEEMHDDVKEEEKVEEAVCAIHGTKPCGCMNEEKIEELDAEVADRIEGLLNIPMKAKFISVGIDLINDFLEDEEMDVEDIINHLGDELAKEYHKAAGHDSAVAIDEEKDEMVKEGEGDNHHYIKVPRKEYKSAMQILNRNAEPSFVKMDTVDDDGMGNAIIYFMFNEFAGVDAEEREAFMYDVVEDLKAHGVDVQDHSAQLDENVTDVEIEAPEDVTDVEMEAPEGEAEDNKEIFSKLVDAYESAKALGDDKLTRQLANTITYFNKSVIFGDEG